MSNYNQKHRCLVRTNGLTEEIYLYAIDPDEAAHFAFQNECFMYVSQKQKENNERLKTLIKLSKDIKTIREVRKYFRIALIKKL